MIDAKEPRYLLVARMVYDHGKVSEKKLGELLPGVYLSSALSQAEQLGLIRCLGHDPSLEGIEAFLGSSSLWAPGANDLSLAVRSNQLGRARQHADTEAAALLRENATVLLETFVNQPLAEQLQHWLYEDACVAHDQWELERDAAHKQQPVPSPEPPKPQPHRPTRVPEKTVQRGRKKEW